MGAHANLRVHIWVAGACRLWADLVIYFRETNNDLTRANIQIRM